MVLRVSVPVLRTYPVALVSVKRNVLIVRFTPPRSIMPAAVSVRTAVSVEMGKLLELQLAAAPQRKLAASLSQVTSALTIGSTPIPSPASAAAKITARRRVRCEADGAN